MIGPPGGRATKRLDLMPQETSHNTLKEMMLALFADVFTFFSHVTWKRELVSCENQGHEVKDWKEPPPSPAPSPKNQDF